LGLYYIILKILIFR